MALERRNSLALQVAIVICFSNPNLTFLVVEPPTKSTFSLTASMSCQNCPIGHTRSRRGGMKGEDLVSRHPTQCVMHVNAALAALDRGVPSSSSPVLPQPDPSTSWSVGQ